MIFDRVDLSILTVLQGDIPTEEHPYKALADSLNISEQEVISRIETMMQQGVIRRIGAVLRQRQAGYKVNALAAWKVEPNSADKAGLIMSQFGQVSHCYLRRVPAEFGYALFTMIHARSNESLSNIIKQLSEQTGLDDMLIIRSIRELKKTSMQFFQAEEVY